MTTPATVATVTQTDPKVRDLRERLSVAVAEHKAAAEHVKELRANLEGRDDELLHLEALAGIGEHDENDVQTRARALDTLRDSEGDAVRHVKRCAITVELLETRLSEAEAAAIADLHAVHLAHIRQAVKSTAGKVREAIAANDKLYQAFEAMRAAGLKMPHPDIVWRDLLSDGNRPADHGKWRSSWHGDASASKSRPRAGMWFEQLEKLGYDVD
jgi:hypothetical protein